MGNASTTERARGIAPQTAAPQTAIPGRSTRIDPSESAAGAAAAGGPLVARIAALRARLASAPLVEMDAAAAKRFEALHAQLRQALRPAALRSVDEAPPAFAASMMPVPSMPPPTGLPPTAMPPTLPPAAAPAVEGEVIFDLAAEEAAAGTVVAEAGALSGLLGLLAAVVAIAVVALLVIAIVELLEQHAHPVPAPHEEPRVDDGPRFGPKGKGKGKGKDKGPDVSPDAPGGPRDKDKKKPTHRGRLQVQGMDMARHPNGELSFPWAQTTPMTKAIAQAQLELLKAACTEEQRKARLEAFEKASDCIASTWHVVPPIFSRSFRNTASRESRDRHLKSLRVDIEIHQGGAFA